MPMIGKGSNKLIIYRWVIPINIWRVAMRRPTVVLRRFMAASGLQQSGRQSFATVGGYPTVGPPLVCYRWPAHYSVVGGPPPASHRGWTSSGGPPVASYSWPTAGKSPWAEI